MAKIYQEMMLDTEAFTENGTTAMETALTLEGFTILWIITQRLVLCRSNRSILSLVALNYHTPYRDAILSWHYTFLPLWFTNHLHNPLEISKGHEGKKKKKTSSALHILYEYAVVTYGRWQPLPEWVSLMCFESMVSLSPLWHTHTQLLHWLPFSP